MKPTMKTKLKMGIDILMTALLPGLMAWQITGQALHEWFGAGELWLFIAHNILNIRWYGNLFKGKYKGIEKVLNDSIEYINIGKVMDSFPDVKFETSESIMDYFNILADGLSTPDITAPESWEDKEWATDFTYSEYNGKNGKIIAIEYSCVIINKTYKAINCYRDDDYSVCGVFDDETELSSGDLALWIADNIEVSEHYKLEDNVVKKEGVDY